jgi:hypothetical protein
VVTQAQPTRKTGGGMVPLSIPQEAGFLFGVIYAFFGLLGIGLMAGQTHIAFSGDVGAAKVVKLFEVNQLSNTVHLAAAALLLVGCLSGAGSARFLNGVIGLFFLAIGVIGFFAIDTRIDVIALNNWVNLLHVVSGLALLGAAAPIPARRPLR